MKRICTIMLHPMVVALSLLLVLGCAVRGPYTTDRDKTAKGAGIGAAAGALAAILDGQDEADEILAGAAIGAVIGGGIGAYMDAQEEKIARIPGTTVQRIDKNTLLVNFNSDVLFAVNAHTLNATARGALDHMAGVLNEYPKTAVIIQGHTDSSGTEAHNQALSERRAASVRNYLIGKAVARERTLATGYGESMPATSNESAEGRRRNRRVDVLLKAKAR